MMGNEWCLDSGAAFYMNRNKEFFSDLEEKDLQMHIKMGYDGYYSATNIGIITF